MERHKDEEIQSRRADRMTDGHSNGGMCSDQTWTDGRMMKNGVIEVKGHQGDGRMEDCGEGEMQ